MREKALYNLAETLIDCGYKIYRPGQFIKEIDDRRRFHIIIMNNEADLHIDKLKMDGSGKTYHSSAPHLADEKREWQRIKNYHDN